MGGLKDRREPEGCRGAALCSGRRHVGPRVTASPSQHCHHGQRHGFVSETDGRSRCASHDVGILARQKRPIFEICPDGGAVAPVAPGRLPSGSRITDGHTNTNQVPGPARQPSPGRGLRLVHGRSWRTER